MIDPAEIAQELIVAAAERRALGSPLTERHPELDLETAYVAQRLVVGARLATGASLVGAKLGLTSRAKQEQMNVGEPLHGWLTSDMLRPMGAKLDLSGFIHPRAEPEIAFLLRESPAAPASIATVLAATQAVFGAIEIIDSRFAGFRFGLPDVVADNASSAAFVLGSRTREVRDVGDLRLTGCVLRVNGVVVATAAGAAVLGHPAESVAWLVNQLAAREQSLPAGAIVLSGALTDAVPLAAGTVVTAEFDGLGHAEVWC
jgi:2-oxo-3-hexenedioate decarboxylase